VLAGDLLQACGADSGPIRIGLVTARGESGSSSTSMQSNCFQMDVDEINKGGGINGRRLTAFTESSQNGGGQEGAVIGGSGAAHGSAIVINTDTSQAGACAPNVILTGQLPNQRMEPLARWLLKNVGRRLFVVGIDDAGGQASLQFLDGAVRRGSHDLIVQSRLLAAGTTDYTPVLRQVQKANPDVLWSLLAGGEAIAFAHQLAGMDVKALVAITGWDEVAAAAAPGTLVGALVSQPWFMTLATPESRDFVAKYQRRFGEGPISAWGEATYDAVYLYKTAVEKAGTAATAQVANAFPEVQFAAPRGQVKIDRATRAMVTNSLLGQVTAHGTIKMHEDLGSVAPARSDCQLG
jgi:urea transport system substrate-binding protein